MPLISIWSSDVQKRFFDCFKKIVEYEFFVKLGVHLAKYLTKNEAPRYCAALPKYSKDGARENDGV